MWEGRCQRIYRAPQEPTSSLLRSGANIGKKELQEEEEEEEEGEEVQGGQEGRRSQEVKSRRLMGKAGVASSLCKKVSSKGSTLLLLLRQHTFHFKSTLYPLYIMIDSIKRLWWATGMNNLRAIIPADKPNANVRL